MNLQFERGRLSYGITEAAEVIGISRTTMWRLIKDKRVTTFKIGGRTLIAAEVLETFVKGAQQAA